MHLAGLHIATQGKQISNKWRSGQWVPFKKKGLTEGKKNLSESENLLIYVMIIWIFTYIKLLLLKFEDLDISLCKLYISKIHLQ